MNKCMNISDMKLLFFDIDGTLITEDERRYFPESAKDAIRQARINGHKTFINTGRVLINVDEDILEVGFDGVVCGCGTNIYADGKELFYHAYSADKSKHIAKMCRMYDLRALFEHKNHTGYDKTLAEGEHTQILKYFKQAGIPVIDDIEAPEFVFDKLALWYQLGNPHVEEFKEAVKGEFDCITRGKNFLELVPIGYSKATGINFLMDYYNVPIENILVFGDSNNDLEMLKYVPNSVAMGVCSDEVAKVASYRTDTVENDGIYKAMKHFGVI